MKYDREKAVAYAHKWAYKRNPKYLNFSGIGGDCTNFVSQCIHAGGAHMNYKKTFGWYYINANNRAPAWTSVKYLYNFLIKNKETGPFTKEVSAAELEPGDIIQLSFTPGIFTHTLFVVQSSQDNNHDNILIAAHTYDSDYRKLSSYTATGFRYLKIDIRA